MLQPTADLSPTSFIRSALLVGLVASGAAALDVDVPLVLGYTQLSATTKLASKPGSVSTDTAERRINQAQLATIGLAPVLHVGPLRLGMNVTYGSVMAGGAAKDEALSFVPGRTTEYLAQSKTATGQTVSSAVELAWLPELGTGFALGPLIAGHLSREAITSSEATQTKPTAMVVPGDLAIQNTDWYGVDVGVACAWALTRSWRIDAEVLGGLRRVRGDIDWTNRSDLAHPGVVYRGTGLGWAGGVDLTWQVLTQMFLQLGARVEADSVAGDAQLTNQYGIITDLNLSSLNRQAISGHFGFGVNF